MFIVTLEHKNLHSHLRISYNHGIIIQFNVASTCIMPLKFHENLRNGFRDIKSKARAFHKITLAYTRIGLDNIKALRYINYMFII